MQVDQPAAAPDATKADPSTPPLDLINQGVYRTQKSNQSDKFPPNQAFNDMHGPYEPQRLSPGDGVVEFNGYLQPFDDCLSYQKFVERYHHGHHGHETDAQLTGFFQSKFPPSERTVHHRAFGQPVGRSHGLFWVTGQYNPLPGGGVLLHPTSEFSPPKVIADAVGEPSEYKNLSSYVNVNHPENRLRLHGVPSAPLGNHTI